MYASKTPRDLNRDPQPYWEGGERVSIAPGDTYLRAIMATSFDPRPEFDHVQHNKPNRLLIDFRRIDGGRGEYADWVRDIDENRGWWVSQMAPSGNTIGYAPHEIQHARKVLTRLANLAEKGKHE